MPGKKVKEKVKDIKSEFDFEVCKGQCLLLGGKHRLGGYQFKKDDIPKESVDPLKKMNVIKEI